MSSTLCLGSVSSALNEEAAARFLADLREISADIERSAKVHAGAEQLTVSDHALPFFRRFIAGQRASSPILCQMQTSSVLLTSAAMPGAALRLDGEDYGVWEVHPLGDVMVEAITGLACLGIRLPPVGRLTGDFREDTAEDDAVLLLTALYAWGERAFRQGACLWLIA